MTAPRQPSGTREYLLARAERLADGIRFVSDAFAAWGARRVIPSTFQPLADVESPQTAITFRERDSGALLALRQDVTAQIRRIVSNELAHLPLPYRLYYVERVWHDDPDDPRQTKERLQAGVEWIGAAPGGERSVLRLAGEIVRRFSDDAVLVLGDARLLPAWRRTLRCRTAAVAFDALRRKDLTAWRRHGDRRFPELPLQLIAAGETAAKDTPPAVIKRLQPLLRLAAALAGEFHRVVVDPVAPAEHPYYTGCFFSVVTGGGHDPWLRGGRYDGRFDRPLAALGFTLDLDAIIDDAALGRMRDPRRPRYLWAAGGAAPAADGALWLPCDPGIGDPRVWARAHGIDGIAERRGRRVLVVDPRSGAVIGDVTA